MSRSPRTPYEQQVDRTLARAQQARAQTLSLGSPDQPRDDHGRWGAGAGAGAESAEPTTPSTGAPKKKFYNMGETGPDGKKVGLKAFKSQFSWEEGGDHPGGAWSKAQSKTYSRAEADAATESLTSHPDVRATSGYFGGKFRVSAIARSPAGLAHITKHFKAR